MLYFKPTNPHHCGHTNSNIKMWHANDDSRRSAQQKSTLLEIMEERYCFNNFIGLSLQEIL